MLELTSSQLDVYRGRIGFAAAAAPSLSYLTALLEHHAAAIPFENLDVRLGRTPSLALDDLVAKLVERRRGGYCFEQNALFAAVLERLGFRVTRLEARVRPAGVAAVLPRTHMVLGVELEGRRWLVDVGFGGGGPLDPVAFDGAPADGFRLVPEGRLHVLQHAEGAGWQDLYAVLPEPVLPIDYEMANHFTATHPGSIFVRLLTVQRSTRAARLALRGRSYSEQRGAETQVRELAAGEVPGLLRETFGLDLPEADVLRALGSP